MYIDTISFAGHQQTEITFNPLRIYTRSLFTFSGTFILLMLHILFTLQLSVNFILFWFHILDFPLHYIILNATSCHERIYCIYIYICLHKRVTLYLIKYCSVIIWLVTCYV